jgi:hypothetical protein
MKNIFNKDVPPTVEFMKRIAYRKDRTTIKAETLTIRGNAINVFSFDPGDYLGIIAIYDGKILLERQYMPGIKKTLYSIPTRRIKDGRIKSLHVTLLSLGFSKQTAVRYMASSYMAHGSSPSKIHYYLVQTPLPLGSGMKKARLKTLLKSIKEGKIFHGPTVAGVLLYNFLSSGE